MSIFSDRLKWLRERKGYTQQLMSEKIDLSRSNYGKYEYGQREPNLDTLKKLPEILGESLDFIIGVKDFDSESLRLFSELMDISYRIDRGRDELNSYNDLSDTLNAIDKLKERIPYLQSGIERYTKKFFEIKGEYINKLESIPHISDKTKDYIEDFRMLNNINELMKLRPE